MGTRSMAFSRRALSIVPRSARTFSAGFGRLDGKVAVVAGAGNPPEEGHGIGAYTSLVLARMGATVVSVSNEAANAQTVTDAILAEGNNAMAYTADCTKAGDVEGLLDSVKSNYGKVDVLINAGIHSALPMGFGKMDESAWAPALTSTSTRTSS